jgi:pyruvate dehydrogenase (quinone)
LRYPVELGLTGDVKATSQGLLPLLARKSDRAFLQEAQQRMAEMTTAVALGLPVKVILLKNNSLAEVMFEQAELGNPEYGCDLPPIDFMAFARACGADGFHCDQPGDLRPTIQAALRSPKAALVEVVVDKNEKPAMPKELRA